MSLGDTVDKRANQSIYWNAHRVLDEFSRTGNLKLPETIDDGLTVEQSALRIIALCADDTYRLDPKKLSAFPRQDGLADEEITIAGIAMGRHDIGLPDGHKKLKQDDKIKPLRFETVKRLTFTSINEEGNPPYKKTEWESERLAHLETCLDNGANIICLGEFDFPPVQHGVDHASFEKAILEKINARDYPVFVVAGSRHEYNKDDETCVNVARIIVNRNLKDVVTSRELNNVFLHNKIVPATKVGEIISPPNSIDVKYYDTKIGRIAVLICVDAYNPTLMFSLIDPQLYKRGGTLRGEPDQLDFILVPAYNFSPKLYYSCQVLSLLCRCTVLLVDACCQWTGATELKCLEAELFFNGRSFSDRRKDNDELGEKIYEEDKVHIWQLKKNFLRAAEAEMRSVSPMPAFDALRNFLRDTRD
ncbi:MAG: hypothetical protein GY927_11280 [bacterium]|nr:hypothetical protein [bacterium]